MPDTELVRLTLAACFVTVALYCLARLVTSFSARTVRPSGRWTITERSSNLAYALMSLGVAATASGLADIVPPAGGMLVFGSLAVWFFIALLHGGPASRTTTGNAGEQGGYTFHHLAGCVGMMYIFVAGYPGSSSPDTAYSAASADSAVAMGHYSLSPGTNVSWLLGLYFLVAATSLGFRVTQPSIRITHHHAAALAHQSQPSGIPGSVPLPRPTSTKLFCTPTGLCASEVLISAGMALVFLGAL